MQHVPAACPHLHGDAKALVDSAQAAALHCGDDAVNEALELTVLPALSQVSSQARPRKVQRIHYQQGPGTGRATCIHNVKPFTYCHN